MMFFSTRSFSKISLALRGARTVNSLKVGDEKGIEKPEISAIFFFAYRLWRRGRLSLDWCRCSRSLFRGGCVVRAWIKSARNRVCRFCRRRCRTIFPAYCGRIFRAWRIIPNAVRRTKRECRNSDLRRRQYPRRTRPEILTSRMKSLR